MNLVLALGIAASSMSRTPDIPGSSPKGPKGKKPKWQKNLQQRWKKSKLGKRVRNLQAFKKKTTRKISQAVKPKKKHKWQKKLQQKWKKSGVGKRVRNVQAFKKKFTRKISQALKPKNILKRGRIFLQGAGDTIVKIGKGVLNSLPDFNKLGKQLGGTLTNAYNTSSKWVRKRFDNVVDISKALKSKYDNALKGAGQAFNNMKKGAQEAVMKKVLQPVMEFLQPLIKRLQGMSDTIMKTLGKIPGFDQITKVLNKFGGATSPGLMKKLGGKAIPIIGGIVNMGFAYDRLSKGDSIGGLIEGTSGILDLIGLIPGGQFGPPISMLMDGYMFARDFVPQIQQGEEAAVKKLGLSGFKKNIDNIFSKLPGIGEIAKMITGGDKEGEVSSVTTTDLGGMPGLSGSGNPFGPEGGSTYNGSSNNIRSTNSSSKKIDGITGYSDDGEEIYVIKNKSSSNLSDNSNKEEKVIALSSGGGSGSDSTASLYRG